MSEGVYPVFVSIIKSELPPIDEMEKEVEKITGAMARICGRPSENVHVIYQPQAKGRVAFGGRIVS
jgi:phenylpyruvate tautomerase PptA (4-oxalocrotonate tautomerase family)